MDYRVTIVGVTDLMMHADSVSWADRIAAWMKIPSNAKLAGTKGDDRCPGFRWVGNLWTDTDGTIVIPALAVGSMLSSAGAGIKGSGRSSLKSVAASGISVFKPSPLLVRGKTIDAKPFLKMADDAVIDFEAHAEAALKAGFILDVRRAPVGMSKHIRVRPRFSNWSAEIELSVNDPRLSKDVLRTLFEEAGRFKGLGDWRPSAPKRPGPHGIFSVSSIDG